jgi:Ca-activated chloride channel family protein
MDANGKTALYDGMLAAHDVLEESTNDRNRINAIVLLSDGADTAETSTLDTVLQRFEETNIAVFPVAYGEDADKTALQAVADFARTIVIEGSAGEINKVFENLSRYF